MVIAGLGFYSAGGDVVSFGEVVAVVAEDVVQVSVEDADLTATIVDDEIVVTIPGG